MMVTLLFSGSNCMTRSTANRFEPGTWKNLEVPVCSLDCYFLESALEFCVKSLLLTSAESTWIMQRLFIATWVWWAGSVFRLSGLWLSRAGKGKLSSCLCFLFSWHSCTWKTQVIISAGNGFISSYIQGILQFLEVSLLFPSGSTACAGSCPFNPHLSVLPWKTHLHVTAQNCVDMPKAVWHHLWSSDVHSRAAFGTWKQL